MGTFFIICFLTEIIYALILLLTLLAEHPQNKQQRSARNYSLVPVCSNELVNTESCLEHTYNNYDRTHRGVPDISRQWPQVCLDGRLALWVQEEEGRL